MGGVGGAKVGGDKGGGEGKRKERGRKKWEENKREIREGGKKEENRIRGCKCAQLERTCTCVNK